MTRVVVPHLAGQDVSDTVDGQHPDEVVAVEPGDEPGVGNGPHLHIGPDLATLPQQIQGPFHPLVGVAGAIGPYLHPVPVVHGAGVAPASAAARLTGTNGDLPLLPWNS